MLSKEGLVKKEGEKKGHVNHLKLAEASNVALKQRPVIFLKWIYRILFPLYIFFIFLLRESRNKFLLLFYIVAKSSTFLMQNFKLQFKN